MQLNILFVILCALWVQCSWAQGKLTPSFLKEAEKEIIELMKEGDIPGLSLVIIQNDQAYIKSYGYTDLPLQTPVTPNTLFEIGSCTKAFTALAVTQLEQQGKITLDNYVSDYLPWFHVTYEDTTVHITLRHLLHHTSGIPWSTIAKIPVSDSDDALEQTVRQLVDQPLHELPGEEYHYATINYDVLALILQTVVGQPFETYLQQNIIDPLGLSSTSIGRPNDPGLMSKGHKIGFFRPREYNAPVYKGNNAAGYVISNANDIAQWLRFQMGLTDHPLYEAAQLTHQRDKTVALHNMSSYARGWKIALDGSGEIYHGGLNPNFTAYLKFRPGEKIGIALLANSNSNFTSFLGNKLMKLLAGEKLEREYDPGDANDKLFSGISIALCIYIIVVVAFMVYMIMDIIRAKRRFEPMTSAKILRFAGSITAILPFLFGIYLLPQAIAGFTWEAILVWTPVSFAILIVAILVSIAVSYLAYAMGIIFPEKNFYKRQVPQILLMSILSGLANVVVIIMVTSAIDSETPLGYLVFYYSLVIAVYLLGRRFVQVNLIKYARGLVYDLRIQLIEKIFSTSYEKFEKIDRGRVYTALNDDVNTIGQSTNLFVALITSIITAIGAFLYLASLAFWATLLTIFLIVAISSIYYLVSQRANRYYEDARDARNVFMRLINGMIDGFKEISLHKNKKLEYKDDVAESAHEFRDKISTADIKFVNAFLVGESLLVVLLGVVSIGMSVMFPNVRFYTIMSFVIVLLYLIGPVNGILGAIPALMNLRIAWNRVQKFLKEIPANLDLHAAPIPLVPRVEKITARGIQFQFKDQQGDKNGFTVGPIDLEVGRGEILFIIGGNGSGKTTLAKMLTGLYQPDEGEILVNGEAIKNTQLSEYFSTVFSPSYLFKKLYNIDLQNKQEELEGYLQVLDLGDKVEVKENEYSTIRLSGGQRKRLALLQCYLEDSPIYLFDEWAADQDPSYRNFFYRVLLPEMKKAGKIVIAITHDDHYFDTADQVVKMDRGKLEAYTHKTIGVDIFSPREV